MPIWLHLITLAALLGSALLVGRAAWYSQSSRERLAGSLIGFVLVALAAALAVYWWRTA